ncbi:MAG: type II toxin-antitoxin system RelE/ParE family toxin [Deltaproteobacteria bacterium]|nr:type II toxin-antitoxin system RelE/ParE family toxin [Deltaproteobacteria bacterium]
MGQNFKVIWAKSAVDDFEEIIDYMAQDSPLTARKLFTQIKTKIETLRSSPHRGRHIPELQKQGILIYRELIIPPWRVMYKVYENKVYIMAIIDSRRNVEDVLLEKLIKKK